ncbi:MAG: hypothetical protein DRJ42_01550 [Deltaproteobacteria bacterium]|nr:MAG: hypothetical protein DRJ42_01550 [Deltaproteobacteria bacterium]
MSAELPTPARVAFAMAGLGGVIWVVQGGLLLGFVAFGDPGGAALAVGGQAWAIMALFSIPFVAMLAVTAQTVHRTAPLFRVAVHRKSGDDALPPSPTALSDAVQAGRRMQLIIGFAWVIAIAFSPWALGHGATTLAVALFALGVAAAGAVPQSLGIRRFMRPWITAFPAAELAPIPAAPYERLASFHAAAVVGSVGLVATAIALQGAPGSWLAITLASGLLTTVGLSFFIHRFSSRAALTLVGDVESLRRRVSVAADTRGMQLVTESEPEPAVPDSDLDLSVREIADELDRVIERLRASLDVERQVKTTIEESQAQKTIFMASMSHDLRSPLNSIMGFSELLTSDIGGDLTPGQRENVAVIQRSGSELLELLNDIIDTARLDAGRLPLRREWTPTVALLAEATRQGRDMVALRTGIGDGFTIEEELEPGLPPLHIDRARIVQALLCLFRHATRAMEGGAIRLSARSAAGAVRVAVTDSGPSVQDEDRQRVFDAFHSITSVSGHRIGGMGLALSLARSLVRAHGGEVHYDASARGGTTIVLSIPTSGPPTTPEE